MNNAYNILQVAHTADDETIRQAYFNAIKRCSVERDPDYFERIRAAYEAIKDEYSRAHYDLFHIIEPDPKALAQILFDQKPHACQRLTLEAFFQCLAYSLEGKVDDQS